MLVFALILSPSDELGQRRLDWLMANGTDLLPFKPSSTHTWQAAHSPISLRAVAWVNDPVAPADKYVALSDGGLALRQGWLLQETGANALGEYLQIDLDHRGNGAFRRNLSPVYPLYVGTRDGVTIIANRKLIAASGLAQATTPSFDRRFMACTIGCGWPLGDRTLFDGVEAIRPGAEPSIKAGAVTRLTPPDDPWHSAALLADYAADPDRFWQERVREFDRVADQFFAADGSPLLDRFFLSGGKDSRLLFAILNRRAAFRAVPISTHGTLYQHDVVVAASIAEHYGMRHDVRDSIFQKIDLARALPEHLFLTEGRSSPADLLTWRAQRQDGIQAIGHELGMRDAIDAAPEEFTPAATYRQMAKLFGNFDRLNILAPAARQELADMFGRQIERYYQTTKDHGNVAWRLYMENRVLHYVSLVKMKDEAQRDSPYLLMTDPIVQTAYTLGLQTRLEERIHYELLKRLDPWLTYDCPFGGQRWPLQLRQVEGGVERFAPTFPTYSTKRAPPRGTYAAFDSNRLAFREFVLDTVGGLGDIVDRSRVEAALDRPSWAPHEMAALWYLVQYCGGLGADWRMLSPVRRDRRPKYFPELRYTNATEGQTNEDATLNAIYRDVVPSAVFAIARGEQGKELLREAEALWAAGSHAPAFNRYAAAAALGEPYAYFIIGRCYLNGDVVAKDAAEALRLLGLAKDKGVAAAASLLASCHAAGKVLPQDKARAMALLEEAVAMGDFWALERMARMKQEDGGDAAALWQRLEQALLAFTRTQKHGHAAYLLGLIYLEGRAGKVDRALGETYLRTASDLGSKLASDCLGARSAA